MSRRASCVLSRGLREDKCVSTRHHEHTCVCLCSGLQGPAEGVAWGFQDGEDLSIPEPF